ncbi:MAG: hypothetical protein RMN51_12855 [Verrucomicrobiota bacterium]|nr:hypothetical protein [Verrucomicrobiota bacterium]
MGSRKAGGVFLLAFSFSMATHAAPIDFESETPGSKPNGYSVPGHPWVVFSDTVGSDLEVGYFGSQGLGLLSLAVNSDSDGSKLRIDFLQPAESITLWYGNDDPWWASATDLAWLEVWNGATLLATLSQSMDLDDVMSQSISYSGSCFTTVFFWYGDSTGNPYTTNNTTGLSGLIEIVDNIEYTLCRPHTVPDGGATLGLLGFACAVVVAGRRLRLA